MSVKYSGIACGEHVPSTLKSTLFILYQVEEEDKLIEELKKIELRKKEREKKTQDLQKLITAADSNIDSRKADKKKTNKKFQQQQKVKETTAVRWLKATIIL